MNDAISRYRMPVVFGPAPGPRQKGDGTPWTLAETGFVRQEWAAVTVRGQRDQLQALLPPGFHLDGEPSIIVQLGYFHDLYWLAGRGYGIVNVLIPATYTGRTESLAGYFMPVIWEGLADAIITGRDELGFSKLPADIPLINAEPDAGEVSGSASWLGCTFFEIALSELSPMTAPPRRKEPTLAYKYVPSTSQFGRNGADIAHVTTGAAASPAPDSTTEVEEHHWSGRGGFTWHRATFEQLPTTYTAVNGLADLELGETVEATYSRLRMPGLIIAGNEQRIVEPAQDDRLATFSGTPPRPNTTSARIR